MNGLIGNRTRVQEQPVRDEYPCIISCRIRRNSLENGKGTLGVKSRRSTYNAFAAAGKGQELIVHALN